MQRVPYICRIIQYGNSVRITGGRKTYKTAVLNYMDKIRVKEIFSAIWDAKIEMLHNFLEVSLTPSNPILHTSRLYTMAANNKSFEKVPLFYEEWDIEASKVLLACDQELQQTISTYSIQLNGITPLGKYYESETAEQLTQKIRSIKAFKGLKAPVVPAGNKFTLDIHSRYFTEDIPYGLLFIKAFTQLSGQKTKNIDRILQWAENFMKKNYLDSNCNIDFSSEDIKSLPLPQNHNLYTAEDIYRVYQ